MSDRKQLDDGRLLIEDVLTELQALTVRHATAGRSGLS